MLYKRPREMFLGEYRIFLSAADPARYRRGSWIHSALGADNGIRLFPTFG